LWNDWARLGSSEEMKEATRYGNRELQAKAESREGEIISR